MDSNPNDSNNSRRRHAWSLVIAFVAFALAIDAPASIQPASAAPTPVLFIANSGNPSSITAVNSVTESVTKSIPIHNGIAVGVGVTPNGSKAYALIVGSDEDGSPGRVLPITTATNVVGKSITVGDNPQSIAFNPNGKYAYVVNGFDAATTPPNEPGTITPINLAEGVAGKAIKVGTNPSDMAISSNGRLAYVPDSNAINGDPTTITPINLATNTAGKTINVAARAVTISLNGQTAFALVRNGVVPISTTTNHPGKTIRLAGLPQAVALSPDGQIAWVLTSPSSGSKKVTLTSINAATFAIGKVVSLPGLPLTGLFFIAITPNGAHIYVLGQGNGKAASSVVSVAASTGIASAAIKVGVGDAALAVNPNSKLVYVLSPGNDYQGPPISSQPKRAPGTVIPINTTTNKLGHPISAGLLADAIAVSA